ncbi:MAG: protocatechuate 3,4-dioxygenase, beta subunit [Chthoniobacter sp.]|jgi:protocatechuate 3,4-dioxygenase beta subunit|nr:protocatechuate 3,4-dioxygenase, beta subunit [Chthoniobacter sp.]
MHKPSPFYIPLNRRRLIQSLALASAGFFTRSAFAELLALTPRTTAGPFYPDHLPLDQDNDLIRIKDDVTPALGTITNLTGRVLDRSGTAIKGALIELWQADNNGTYIHSRGAQEGVRDAHFQGYGKFETGSEGGWKFRTIKPALYPGRTRHYHFGITLPGQERRFTTQLFFAGEPGNARDMVLGEIRDEVQRASVIREFVAVPDTKELAATWDIVMGLTPGDSDHDDHDDRPPRRGGPEGGRPPRGEGPGRPERPGDGQRPPPPPR